MAENMLVEQEYIADTVEEGLWYENGILPGYFTRESDLQLAAELGKTLLERNRDLENQLKQSTVTQTEQAKEIDLLTKQLEVLRNVNESRMRVYEEVDHSLQEIEKENSQLKQDAKTDKEKIKALTESIEEWEQKCEDLQAKIDKLRDAARQKKQDRRAQSVPGLSSRSGPGEYNPEAGGHRSRRDIYMNEKEWDGLKTTINNLKEQLTMERRKRLDMEKEMSIVLADNNNLEAKIRQMEEEQTRIGALENELQVVEIESGKICKLCGVKLNQNVKADESVDLSIEHDDLDTTGLPNGQLIRLKNGGSAFGSRESLNMMGLEAEEDSPTISSRDFHDFDSLITPSRAPTGSVKASDSLLGELEEQYRRLVYKYESLIEAKARRDQDFGQENGEEEQEEEEPEAGARPASLSISKEVQTVNRRSLIFKSPIDPCDAHFEHGPPEYKMLFKEIFDTLRKSVVFEDEMLLNKAKIS